MNATGQIVVGVDGSEASQQALRWAFSEAKRRSDDIRVVTAWHRDEQDGADACSAAAQRAAALLARQVETVPVMERVAIVVVKQVREGRPAEVLADASRGADLLVVGSHRSPEVCDSTGDQCMRMASCPVVVLPAAS